MTHPCSTWTPAPTYTPESMQAVPRPSLLRAAAALKQACDSSPAEPFRSVLLRAAHPPGRVEDFEALVEFWHSREPGTPSGASRYRWELNHRVGAPLPPYAKASSSWRAWRPSEQVRLQQDPFAFEERLILPMLTADNVDLLQEVGEGTSPVAALARRLLQEASPIVRRDFARHVQMLDPWADTFALWCVVRRPRVLSLLHPVAVALAATYAAGCPVPLVGSQYPFFGAPLTSATAQLASALLALGSELDLAARLAAHVSDARQPNGAWHDANEPCDLLTTLVAADLLGRIDPSFDPEPTLSYFDQRQRPDGLWSVLGPEAPWLTWEILQWATSIQTPFARRFRWPHRSRALRDPKTNLPSFAYFVELAELFSTLQGLSTAPADLAFIDLIGFRAFNNRFGQEAGDRVLELFASSLAELPCVSAIRDGGDEFLVVGAPGREPLCADLDAFRKRWRLHFVRTFGTDIPPVAPRILVARGLGRDLRRLRERLGQEITGLKDRKAPFDGTGLLVASSG